MKGVMCDLCDSGSIETPAVWRFTAMIENGKAAVEGNVCNDHCDEIAEYADTLDLL